MLTSISIRPRWPRCWASGSPVSSTTTGRRSSSATSSPRPGFQLSTPTLICRSPHFVPGGPPHLRRGVRLPVAPRRVVHRATSAAELVDADLPGPPRQLHELRPAELRPGCPEYLGHFRLLPEQCSAADDRRVSGKGTAGAAGRGRSSAG